MVGQRTQRRGVPGGLRAQLLIGLCVLLVAGFSLVALVSLHVVRRQLQTTALSEAQSHARLLAHQLADAQADNPAAELAEREGMGWAGSLEGDTLIGSSQTPEALRAALLELSRESSTGSTIVDVDGHSHVVAIAAMPGADSSAAVAQSMAPIQSQVAETRSLLLVYLGLDALFILIIGYGFFTFVVVRPIRAIGVASERAARGDLASPVSVLPANEFGQVGRQFNQMLAELRSNRQQLEERLDELDQANQKLRATQDSLIRSEKLASVGELAAGVAHEVGNPLAAISGYLELLEDDDLDADTAGDILERSQREVERIRTIIQDLLDYSRQDADPDPESVALGDCVDEAINLVCAQPKSRRVDIEQNLPDDLPDVEAVGSQIVQVLVNLLINAIDALADSDEPDEPPTIEVDAEHRPDAGEVLLRVRDNGPGIASDKLQRVFDPFFTTKDPGQGTGLGLSICLRIMQRLGGDIRLESSSGEGTTFELVFPVERSG
jgi:two-component system, NtrC family, sensor kinase